MIKSNKILISLFFTLILLSIGFMLLLKANLVPATHSHQTTYKMGDLKELKAEGNYSIRVLQYIGDSEVQFKSNQPVMAAYSAQSKGFGRVLLQETGMGTSESANTTAHVRMKECNRFEIGGNVDMIVANPLEGGNMDFVFADNAAANIAVKDVDTLNITLMDNTNFEIHGSAKYLNLICKGNVDIEASNLEALSAQVNVQGNCIARLNVKNGVVGEKSEMSSLTFKYAPATVNVEGLE